MKRPSLNGVYLHTAGEWRALNVSVMTQSTCKPHRMTDTALKRLTSPCTSWYFHITLAEGQQIKRDDTGDALEGEETEIFVCSLRFHNFLGERRAARRQSCVDSVSDRKGHSGHSDETSGCRWLDRVCPSLEFQKERNKYYDLEDCREKGHGVQKYERE